jgi:hypothetical protein
MQSGKKCALGALKALLAAGRNVQVTTAALVCNAAFMLDITRNGVYVTA